MPPEDIVSGPKVAVVGSGPAGLFAAARLAELLPTARVDVLDRLLTPFGLVRYGVAPDHPTIKSVQVTLERILASPRVRFLGGIDVGSRIRPDELAGCYHAIIYATGAPEDQRLGIPGEDLPGCVAASALVRWYNGHPDAAPLEMGSARSVVVLGAGNVALDVVRFFTRDVGELAATDLPDSVLGQVRSRRCQVVHVVARRSAQHARFSNKELRELGRLTGVTVTCRPGEIGNADGQTVGRETAANLALLRDWSLPSTPSTRTVHLRFSLRPIEILGSQWVEGIRLERTETSLDGDVRGVGEIIDIGADVVVRAVGYTGAPIPGLAFDSVRGVMPNVDGRLQDEAGHVIAHHYVTGWVKRGPSGVIGTNKPDAHETVDALVADLAHSSTRVAPRRIEALLAGAGADWVGIDGWRAIEAAEAERGVAQGRARAKIADWATLRAVASAATNRQRVAEGVAR